MAVSRTLTSAQSRLRRSGGARCLAVTFVVARRRNKPPSCPEVCGDGQVALVASWAAALQLRCYKSYEMGSLGDAAAYPLREADLIRKTDVGDETTRNESACNGQVVYTRSTLQPRRRHSGRVELRNAGLL